MLQRLIRSVWPSPSKKSEPPPVLSPVRPELNVEAHLRIVEAQVVSTDAVLHLRHEELARESQHLEGVREQIRSQQEELLRLRSEARESVRDVTARAVKTLNQEALTQAILTGYRLAWDTMLPLMQEGVVKSRQAIHDAAVEETLTRLESVIASRLDAVGKSQFRPVAALLSKQEQFQIAREAATTPEERLKYDHFLTAIGWSLNGDRAH